MENASKALLMAGGILISLLLISLIIFAWSKYSDYYDTKDSLAEIDDVAKFNMQFTNYDRDDVHGYEIISLCNKIADYNMRFADVKNKEGENQSKNDYKMTPVKLEVFFNSAEDMRSLSYDDEIRLFDETQMTYIQDYVSNQLEDRLTTAGSIENKFGGTNKATKLAKSIRALLSEKNNESEKVGAVIAYNKIMNTSISEDAEGYDKIQKELEEDKQLYAYYEYYQFKKSIFKCTKIEYEAIHGRVANIEFTFERVE